MAKTSGQLEERNPNHWRLRIFLGRKATGKRRYLSETVQGTKKEAEKVLRELLGKKDKGRLGQPSRQALGAYLHDWLDVAVKPRVRAKTPEFYRVQVKLRLKPTLGDVRLNKLSTLEIQRWANGLVKQGLSPRSVRAAFATLHSALRQAVRWRMLASDPSELVELPRPHRTASVLLAGGVHVKAVSKRLGHASTAFTMDTYVHSLPTVQEEAAARLEELFSAAKA